MKDLPFCREYSKSDSPKTSDKSETDFLEAVRDLQELNLLSSTNGRITVSYRDQAQDVFPFLILRQDQLFWINGFTQGGLVYASFSGDSYTIDFASSEFDGTLDALLERGWYRVLIKLLEEVPEQHKKAYENRLYSSRCFLACDYYKARQFNNAVAEFEKAMLIQSNMPQLYYNLALSYARLNEHRKGIHILSKLSRIRPNQPKTYELLGDFYFHLTEWERALSLYRRAFEFSDNKINIETKIKKIEEKTGKTKTEAGKKMKKRKDFQSIPVFRI